MPAHLGLPLKVGMALIQSLLVVFAVAYLSTRLSRTRYVGVYLFQPIANPIDFSAS